PAQPGVATAAGRGGQARLGADGLPDHAGAVAGGRAVGLALGQGDRLRAGPPAPAAADVAPARPDRRRRLLPGLRPVRGDHAGRGRLPGPAVVAVAPVYPRAGGPGAVRAGAGLLLAQGGAGGRPAAAAGAALTGAGQEGRRLAVD